MPPEPPRRSLVSTEQLQQWRDHTGPRSGRQAAPAAWASSPVLQPAPASSSGPSTSPLLPDVPDAMRAVPSTGHNTLVVYAAERALSENGTRKGKLPDVRSALGRFGTALLEQQPPVTLHEFVDRFRSTDPAQRAAAEALRDAVADQRGFRAQVLCDLDRGLEALSEVPSAQRMLTLQEALHSKMQAPALQTLLPAADRALLQQVQHADRTLSPVAAGTNQVLLTRLGVALTAKGHGGLAGWLALHNQPDGYRRAAQLLERFKSGPELALSALNQTKLGRAAERLQACDVGLAASDTGPARLAPNYPAGFPAAEAALIDARLQAGLNSGLARSTLAHYGRELIGLSEWLCARAQAPGSAAPPGLQALADLSGTGRQAECRALVDAFAAGRPVRKHVSLAVELLLHPPAPESNIASTSASQAAVPPSRSTAEPAAIELPDAAQSIESLLGELDDVMCEYQPDASARPGPSQAGTSNSPALSWSIGSTFERLGAQGIQTMLDDGTSAYQPQLPSRPSSPQAADLNALFDLILSDGDTQQLMQRLEDMIARDLPDVPVESPGQLEAVINEYAAELAPAAGSPAAEGAEPQPAAVTAMSAEDAARWFNSRRQDVQMALMTTRGTSRAEMMRFAEHLAATDGAGDGLNGFLQRYESSDPTVRRDARLELQQYLAGKGRALRSGSGLADPLVSSFETLARVPAADRPWTDPARRITSDAVPTQFKRWLLPPQDRALLEQNSRARRLCLARFTHALLNAGHGGLMHWLIMFHEGRGRPARGLMLDFIKADQSKRKPASLPLAGDRLQAAIGTPASQRLAVQGTGRTTVGAVARPELPRPSASADDASLARPQLAQAVMAAMPMSGAAPLPSAAASSSAGPSNLATERAPVATIPLEGANTLMAFALAEQLELDGKGNSETKNARNTLMKFGDALLRQQQPLSLEGFLAHALSDSPRSRAAADAHKASITSNWSKNDRNLVNRALNRLGELPPAQRTWSLQQALGSKMQAAALKTLLAPRDRDLLDRVNQHPIPVSGATAGRHQVMLIRFAVALLTQGCAGLTQWLEMHHRPDGHGSAKDLLDGFTAQQQASGQSRKDSVLAAVKRLHEVVGMPETESLHPQLRTPANRAAAAVRFPDGFPAAEASLIEARLAAGQARDLSIRTLENYRRELAKLSEWLRTPEEGSNRPARPEGLQSLVALAGAGDRASLLAVREAFFGPGKPGGAQGALDLLLDLKLGSR